MKNLLVLGLFLVSGPLLSQTSQQITPGDFEKLSKTWSEVGDVTLNPLSDSYEITDGTGILLNLPGKRKGEDIRTSAEYGDFDLSFEYLMFPGSNSGVYIQGRYEIQLLDSWRRHNVSSADNGGIYKRFEGERELDGHAPRQNASRAPGLWQKMELSFQAPRFDESGQKIENAKLLHVTLNGIEVQKDVELFAPTAGAWDEEAAKGPLRIQGDHGAIAFRNMEITTFDSPLPTLTNLTYQVHKGMINALSDLPNMPVIAEGEATEVSPGVSPISNGYVIHYSGDLTATVGGRYTFTGGFNGGAGLISIDGTTVFGPSDWQGSGSVELSQGIHKVDLYYAKLQDWAAAGLRFMVRGPGIRDISFHDENVNIVGSNDPIYLEAPTILRSFMDISDNHRITRAVSVGSSQGVHYTYDMDHGTIVHGWRGEFIDATPMWDNRGDGSSRPRGAVTSLDGIDLIIRKADNLMSSSDTTGTGFRPRGYTLVGEQAPRFTYSVLGNTITDEIHILPDADGLTRKVTSETQGDLKIRLAAGNSITKVEEGLWRIDGSYYIKLDPSLEPEIVSENEKTSVWAPLKDEISYEIIF